MRYGFLLQNFTEKNTIPVFRTESQYVHSLRWYRYDVNISQLRDRMLASAMNFAIGFFGYPFEGQYQQSITIEADGVSTLRYHPRSFNADWQPPFEV